MQLDRLLTACKQNICLNIHYSWWEKQDDLPSLVQFCCLWPQHWHPMSCGGKKKREREVVTSLLKYTSNTQETMATAKQCHPKRIKCRKSSFQGNVISHTTTMFSVEISRTRQALLYSFRKVHFIFKAAFSTIFQGLRVNWKSRRAADSLGFLSDRSKTQQ